MQRILFFSLLALFVIGAPVQPYAARSITEYTMAIEKSPEDRKYKFYHLRGMAYIEIGDIGSAINDFSTSIKLKPNMAAYIKRGEMYFERGTLNMAVNDFSEAIKINPTLEAYKMRGLTYLVQGSLELAIEDGTEIINMAPNVSESYNIRMEAYAQIGEAKLAREDARRALALDRKNKVAQEVLVKNPEKITLQGSRGKYKSIQVENYKIWASTQGFAFTKKAIDGQAEEQTKGQPAPAQQKR